MPSKKVYLIGETGLASACLELLIQNFYEIVGVITQHWPTQELAHKNRIPIFSHIKAAQKHISHNNFDYLISIANPAILPRKLLKCPMHFAINYHDAPLPQYAGTHASSWAILNNESHHGISWHIMEEKVDAGDLLKQRLFPISAAETTASLNIKCFEAALHAFQELLQDIQEGTVFRQPQDLSKRSFYSKHAKPEKGAILNWNESAESIYRLCRALDFGPYLNSLATAKFLIENVFYIPESLSIEETGKLTTLPGQILELNSQHIKIAASPGAVVLTQLRDMPGELIDIATVSQLHSLEKGNILPIPGREELEKIHEHVVRCGKEDHDWSVEYSKISALQIPWGRIPQGSQNIYHKKISLSEFSFPPFCNSSKNHFYLISLFLVYMARLTNQSRFSVRWSDDKPRHALNENFKIYTCDVHGEEIFSECILKLMQHLEWLDRKECPLKDLFYRSHQEKSLLPVEIVTLVKDQDVSFAQGTALQVILSPTSLSFKARIETLDRGTIDDLMCFLCVLSKIFYKFEKVKEMPLMTLEQQRIREDCNKTNVSYRADQCIHEIFEQQATQTPDAVAVECASEQITYSVLNKQANRLARHLLKVHSSKNTPYKTIGILIDRSVEMIVSMLACLKAGFAYLPIDVDYPEKRINYLFQDADVALIITKKAYLSKISNASVIVLADEWALPEDDSNLGFYNLHFLIYILYTSGSTGLPKGSGLSHASVSNLLNWYCQEFNLTPMDHVLIFTAFGFDLTQKNILGGLISGSRINLWHNQRFDPRALIRYVYTHQISFINCPPSAFYTFVEEQDAFFYLSSLRIVLLGGEGINPLKIRPFLEHTSCQIINTYGPTECADLALTHDIKLLDLQQNIPIPLGKNVGNVLIYVLDHTLSPVPVGCLGEIYLAGISLGIGYLNKAALTAEVFIANPFGNGGRLYRTKDVGRYNADGTVEFCGRVDHQVKVRGFRIELGEIEYTLSQCTGVNYVKVLVREDIVDHKKIVAYVVSKVPFAAADAQFIADLQNVCTSQLPAYMCPSHIIVMEHLPLTPNGKIDLKALPKPEERKELTSYEQPQGAVEQRLATIWSTVLGVSQISRTDNFFSLGGDSIIAIKLVASMREAGFFLSISDLYQYKSIAEIIRFALSKTSHSVQKYEPFSLVNKELRHSYEREYEIQDIYPASAMQQGLLFESLLDHTAYHDIFSYKIYNPFNKDKFTATWEALVAKHPLLRASFHANDLHAYIVIEHKHIQVSDKIILTEEKDTDTVLNREIEKPFLLHKPGLFRLIVQTWPEENEFVLICSFHHAILDGWSLNVLIGEFIDLYVKSRALQGSELLSYGRYIRDEIHCVEQGSALKYFRESLQDYSPKKNIFRNTSGEQAGTPYRLDSFFSPIECDQIIKLAQQKGVSVDVIFLTAYVYALSRINGSNDVVIGLIVNNRAAEKEADTHVGFFLNMLPLRIKILALSDQLSIDALIEQVAYHKSVLLKEKGLPYQKLLSSLSLGKDICSFAFNYMHFHGVEQALKNQEFSRGPFYEKANIPYTLNVSRELENFHLFLNITQESFSREMAQKLLEYMRYFMSCITTQTAQIEYVLPQEVNLLKIWNQTTLKYEPETTLQELFDLRVDAGCDAIAFVSGKQHLSYSALRSRANHVASYLHLQELKEQQVLGIAIPRSIELAVALLAALKNGNPVLILGEELPQKRIDTLLQHAQITHILVSRCHEIKKVSKSVQRVFLEDELSVTHHSSRKPRPKQPLQSILCLIYTSGSTGIPKGVALTHGGFLNRLQWMLQVFPFEKNSVVCQKTSPLFVDFLWEFWGALIGGVRSVVIRKEDLIDLEHFVALAKAHFFSHLVATPSFIDTLLTYTRGTTFQRISLSGEKASNDLLYRLKSHTKATILNIYGSSEITADATYLEVPEFFSDHEAQASFIGKPIANTSVYVLDQSLMLVPIGTVGELYISGEGLAQGYWGRGDLTAEHFIANPFEYGTRMYRTGDLVRWRKEGTLEYIGRIDHQIKLRGYRIELGEVESHLLAIPGVQEAAVVLKKHGRTGDAHLVGYWVPSGHTESIIHSEILEKKLRDYLPDYMIPMDWVMLGSFPVTISGKLDRNRLPDPGLRLGDNYVAPRTALETQICEVWEDLLERAQISVREDFFRIGGSSILAIKVINALKTRLKIHDITIKDLFAHRSIEALSRHMFSKEKYHVVEQGEI